MAWTDPKTWSNEPLIAGDMNTHIRDNLNALKDPPSDVKDSSMVNFTTTSTTFVDIDTTFFSSTINTNGGDVLVACLGTFYCIGASAIVDFTITVDGVAQGGTNGLQRTVMPTAYIRHPLSLLYVVTGLSAGSHTITLQWKTNGGSLVIEGHNGTINVGGQWFVREVS